MTCNIVFLLVAAAAVVVNDVEVGSGGCEVLNVPQSLVGNGGVDEGDNHGDDVLPPRQGDDSPHATLVGGGLRIVGGSLWLLQVPHAAWHEEV